MLHFRSVHGKFESFVTKSSIALYDDCTTIHRTHPPPNMIHDIRSITITRTSTEE